MGDAERTVDSLRRARPPLPSSSASLDSRWRARIRDVSALGWQFRNHAKRCGGEPHPLADMTLQFRGWLCDGGRDTGRAHDREQVTGLDEPAIARGLSTVGDHAKIPDADQRTSLRPLSHRPRGEDLERLERMQRHVSWAL